jgi:hypothetical protein
MPMMIRNVTATVISTAGRLMIAASLQPAAWMAQQGDEATLAGKSIPRKS